jgi:hypothetical protein
MTPETYNKVYDYFQIIFLAEWILLGLVLAADVLLNIQLVMNPSPEVIYYFQNCNNLTLFPDGCQVLS